MGNTVQGTVSQTSVREWEGRNGVINLHSFQIEGSNRWFRTGTTTPPFRQGDGISFAVDGKGNVDMATVSKVDVGANPAPSARAAAQPRKQYSNTGTSSGAGSTGGSKNDYWENKDKFYREEEVPKISLSAARDAAVRLVAAALAADALSFGNTAKGKRLDMILEYVDQVRDRFLLATLDAKNITARLLEEGISDSVEDGRSGNSGDGDNNNNDGWE